MVRTRSPQAKASGLFVWFGPERRHPQSTRKAKALRVFPFGCLALVRQKSSCPASMPSAVAIFSRDVLLRRSLTSCCAYANWLMPRRSATRACVMPRCSRHARGCRAVNRTTQNVVRDQVSIGHSKCECFVCRHYRMGGATRRSA